MPGRRGVLAGGLAMTAAGSALPAEPVSEETMRAILQERVEIGRQCPGIVAGLIDAGGHRLVTYGRGGAADDRPLDADTVFEIGSITKVLTALLLTDMVVRGEVGLDDPVAKYLPASVSVPTFQGKPITLLDLATYTSGLPRIPGNMVRADPLNPYADYTVEQMYAFLGGYTLPYEPGTHYEYANLGFGLLGHALALRAGRGYEDLLIERICQPLGLVSTRITLTADMRARLAQGYNGSLAPTPLWDIPALAGAGAVRSTANDLFVLLDACLGRRDTPLRPAMAMLVATRRATGMRHVRVGLGWFVSIGHADEIFWKDGGTGGFATFIGYSAQDGRAAIVLTNAGNYATPREVGLHLINPLHPLIQQRRQVPVDPAMLARYPGTYPLTPQFAITVRVRDGRLFIQATGQAEYEAFPESDTAFFLRVVDAQITFECDAAGEAVALVLHQNGRDLRGPRT